MTWRDRPRRDRLSDRLRRETERPWRQDPWLSSTGGGGCDWDGDHHHADADADGWDDGGEEFV